MFFSLISDSPISFDDPGKKSANHLWNFHQNETASSIIKRAQLLISLFIKFLPFNIILQFINIKQEDVSLIATSR